VRRYGFTDKTRRQQNEAAEVWRSEEAEVAEQIDAARNWARIQTLKIRVIVKMLFFSAFLS